MLKAEIIKKAYSLGIEHIGFCRHKGKSAVACLFPYYVFGEASHLSVYARGKDYHKVATEKLSALMADFDPEAELFSDIGPEDNIYVAQKCGLGVRGKNMLLINEDLGSWFFIGYALTEKYIEPDAPSFSECIGCGKCTAACPGGALQDTFLPERCVSYLTQKKGALTSDEEKLIKKSGFIFGCDICQDVCPMNFGKGKCLSEFKENRILSLDKDELSSMSNRAFMRKYADRAFSWRGKAPLLRNLELYEK